MFKKKKEYNKYKIIVLNLYIDLLIIEPMKKK